MKIRGIIILHVIAIGTVQDSPINVLGEMLFDNINIVASLRGKYSWENEQFLFWLCFTYLFIFY